MNWLQRTIRSPFRNAFLGELKDYRMVQEKGPSALDVQATIVDYRNAAGACVPNVRRELKNIVRKILLRMSSWQNYLYLDH